MQGRKIGDALKGMNGRNFRVKCTINLINRELVAALMHGCEILVHKSQKRPEIRPKQMDILHSTVIPPNPEHSEC